MRLRWTIPASQDLYRIVQRIQEDNPTAASKIVPRRSTTAAARSNGFLVAAARAESQALASLSFLAPYIVVYHIKDQSVEVLRIYHGAQDWP